VDLLTKETIEVTELILPWIGILLSVSIIFWVKDFVQSFVKGFNFRRDKHFLEGDEVKIDDEYGRIIKIGLTQSVFEIYGEDEKTWRYIYNDRIHFLKLEKIIRSNGE
jgi:hypothetical protein